MPRSSTQTATGLFYMLRGQQPVRSTRDRKITRSLQRGSSTKISTSLLWCLFFSSNSTINSRQYEVCFVWSSNENSEPIHLPKIIYTINRYLSVFYASLRYKLRVSAAQAQQTLPAVRRLVFSRYTVF